VLALLAAQRGAIPPDAPHQPSRAGSQQGAAAVPQADSLGFLRLPAVWMCFGFFLLTACALGAIQGFTAPALMKVYGLTLAAANMGYTAYMLASAGGMVVGGFIAARSTSHDRLIAAALLASAVLALVLAAAVVPGWMAVVLMGAVGFASGIAGPSRDLMIRAAAPKNATGRVFGVVYSGLDSGLALGPLLFGAVLDAQMPAMVFAGIALFQLAAVATAVGVGSQRRAAVLQNA
ncbi:MFS transporter, partial [Massilia arenosa]